MSPRAMLRMGVALVTITAVSSQLTFFSVGDWGGADLGVSASVELLSVCSPLTDVNRQCVGVPIHAGNKPGSFTSMKAMAKGWARSTLRNDTHCVGQPYKSMTCWGCELGRSRGGVCVRAHVHG
jgi:hypothetical protein